MLRSIRAEWYKAVRRPYFSILFFTCSLLTMGAVYCLYLVKNQSPGITPIGLSFALSLSPLGMIMGLWLVAVGGDLIFSEQYKYHTLKNEVSFGIPRTRIYLSRWAAVFLVMLLLYAVLVAVYTLSALLLLGLERGPSDLCQRIPAAWLSVSGSTPHLGWRPIPGHRHILPYCQCQRSSYLLYCPNPHPASSAGSPGTAHQPILSATPPPHSELPA